MTREERQKARDKIRDQGIAMMDAIKAKHGEDHPMFWAAMAVTTENLRAFDEGRPLQEFTDAHTVRSH
jgi:hypothetical protein